MSYKSLNYDPSFKQVKNIYEDRLRQFIDRGGPYAQQNLTKFLDKERIRLDQQVVSVEWYQVAFDPNTPPVAPEKRPSWEEIAAKDKAGQLEWRDAYMGQPFGPSWSTTWFKVKLKIPSSWVASKEQLIFDWDCENEGIVVEPGTLLPKTAFSGNGERTEYLLPKGVSDLWFYIECGNNGMFGVGRGSSIDPPDPNRFFHLSKADLVWPNWEARALFIDFWMLGDAARELPDSSWQKQQARKLGNDVMDIFDPDDPSTIARCRKFLKEKYFDEFTDDPKVYQQGDPEVKTNAFAIGHCHIDTAWLWPFAETKRKVVRSWSSQTTLMDEFPEYQFAASSAQQYKWLLEAHPKFFNEVLVPKVEQGQFLPLGGSWLENDTNMPSGESLCRQFFYGQRFFLKHFGFKSDIYWLPDTFGYSSQIPQICRISGINKFLTQKLSWNNINDFPHSTFNWAGIDGSQILAHMPPGNTYTAMAHFGDVIRTANQNKSAEDYGSGLMVYGYGDGGGGPTREMLDKMRRIRSMNNRNGNIVPKLQVGKSVAEFYDDILKNTDDGKRLATWIGELYFEFHRGTYTTQAMTKKLMRFAEVKMHNLEWLATKASILVPNYKYPSQDINNIWETICLSQFHDVIPGTCIEIVYKFEAIPMLKEAIKRLDELTADVLKEVNQNSTYLAKVSALQWLGDEETSAKKKVYPATIDQTDDSIVLSNGKLKVTISKDTGTIVSIYDCIEDTEYLDLERGRNKLGANQFLLFDDKPLSWQAWDTELYSVNQYKYLNRIRSMTVLLDGSDLVSVEFVIGVNDDCAITTTYSLSSVTEDKLDESKIEINTKVTNWNQMNKFLKVEFPVNVWNDFASYETQFGITKRPTHYNTSWDVAKFEICHHKFADYSDYTKGVSILNDCKYGFSTHGNLMRLSLIRSPKLPDEHADMGDHEINYAIYPHKGPLTATTAKLGIEFNYGAKYDIAKTMKDDFDSFLTISGNDNVILSNLKRGEDDKDLESNYAIKTNNERSFVARIYEAMGGEARATLRTSLNIKSVLEINSLESETVEELSFKKSDNDNSTTEIRIKLRPYEILTLKLILE